MNWFEVDKKGLAKLLERKGKAFVLYELVQNAWDEKTSRVDITLLKLRNGVYSLTVKDDNPTGFSKLSYAYTLFAESEKKGNAEKRGRFNLGEKLVLALADEAAIATTTGTVWFDAAGRRVDNTVATKTGSEIALTLRLNKGDVEAFNEAARKLLPPEGIETYYNDELLPARPVVKTIHANLPTEIGDDEGILRPSQRKTTVELVATEGQAFIYEMGIPVVETEGRWHINVGQKVPLNMDRDNVTPSYLAKLRTLVTESMIDHLEAEDANSAWVRDAVTQYGDKMEPDTIDHLAYLRFGDKRVAYDPSDPEANNIAVSQGYTVVHGGSLNRAEWDAVKRVGAILPAGQVTPSPKPFKPDGSDLKLQPEDKWTPAMHIYKMYAQSIGKELLGFAPSIKIANDSGWHFYGCYGGRQLTVNVAKVGYDWFEPLAKQRGNLERINDFLIHEFGHEYSSNHLSEEYYDALTKLGGKLVQVALEKPELFTCPAMKEVA